MSYTLDDMMLDIQLRVPLKDIREKVRADAIDELLNKWCDETCGVNRCIDYMDRCEFGEFLMKMKGDRT